MGAHRIMCHVQFDSSSKNPDGMCALGRAIMSVTTYLGNVVGESAVDDDDGDVVDHLPHAAVHHRMGAFWGPVWCAVGGNTTNGPCCCSKSISKLRTGAPRVCDDDKKKGLQWMWLPSSTFISRSTYRCTARWRALAWCWWQLWRLWVLTLVWWRFGLVLCGHEMASSQSRMLTRSPHPSPVTHRTSSHITLNSKPCTGWRQAHRPDGRVFADRSLLVACCRSTHAVIS